MIMEIEDIIKEISNVTNMVTDEQLTLFIKKINEAKRIIVCGTGRSGLMLNLLL